MKRLLGQTFVVVVVGVGSTVFAPACAENDQTIFVHAALAPAVNRQNNSCVYSSDPTQTFISQGTVDVAGGDTYRAALLVGSQLVARGDIQNARSEPNRVHVNGAVVKVTDPSGAVLSEFTSLGSSIVNPQANNVPSYSPVFVTIVDEATTAGLNLAPYDDRLVIANVKVFGRTLGGVDVETGEFAFPVRVCNGCLVSFSAGNDPASPSPYCELPLNTSGGGGATQAPCTLGQDESFPCQACLPNPVCTGELLRSRPPQP